MKLEIVGFDINMIIFLILLLPILMLCLYSFSDFLEIVFLVVTGAFDILIKLSLI